MADELLLTEIVNCLLDISSKLDVIIEQNRQCVEAWKQAYKTPPESSVEKGDT